MSRINRTPGGLQTLLGSQNFGDNPSELGPVVAPTLDLLPFYGSEVLRSQYIQGTRASEGEVARTALGGRVAVIGASARIVAGVVGAGYVQFSIGLTKVSGEDPSKPVFLATSENQTIALGDTPAFGMTFPFPLIIESGVQVLANFDAVNGGNFTVELGVLYYDLTPGGAI